MIALKRVQRIFTRTLPVLENFSYEEKLDRKTLFALEQKRLKGDLIGVYKIMRSLLSSEVNNLRVYIGSIWQK